MNEKTKLTFENVPEWTYWRNPNSGVIYHCGVNRNTWVEDDEFDEGGYDYDTNSKHMSVTTNNTKVERTYYYTWDEIVEKFEYLGECDDEDFYVNILSNRKLYREFRYCKDRLPRLRRLHKSEPEAGWDVEIEEMLSNMEKYHNLETFKYNYGF